jgi:hypothetical protein
MNINKAIRKQRKSYKRFLLSMCFVFFALPAAMLLYGRTETFYIAFLAGIELLVAGAVYARASRENLEFEYNMGWIRIRRGILGMTESVNCDRIIFVDAEPAVEKGEVLQDFSIILVSDSKYRNKKLKAVDPAFREKYALADNGSEQFYLAIDSGGLLKYRLLDAVFKSCVKAAYSENAIERIKFYRTNLDS